MQDYSLLRVGPPPTSPIFSGDTLRHGAIRIAAIAAILIAAACGEGDVVESGLSLTPADPSATNAPAVSAAGLPAAVGGAGDSLTLPSTTGGGLPLASATSAPTGPTVTLPGTLVDFGPGAGDLLAVVGLNYDAVLNLRIAPGVDQQVVARLGPLERDVVATGATRVLTQTLWHEVTFDGVTGWASASFLGYLGGTSDATSEIIAIAGRTPLATSVHGLGRAVAALSDPDGSTSRIRVSAPGVISDHADVTVDVVGLADDAVLGYRIHVFATRLPDDSAYALTRADRTVICAWGVDNGVCR